MKRILAFSLVYYPSFVGGAEVAVKEIADRISPSDIEFDMVTLRLDASLPRFEKVGNVNVYRVGFASRKAVGPETRTPLVALNKYLFPFMGAWKARALQRARNYDATWALMANYAGFAALFFKWLHPEIPFLLNLQEGDPISHIKKRVGVLYPLFVQIFRKADQIQTLSHYLADFAAKMGATAPIQVVPNGVDVQHFSQKFVERDLAALKDKLGKKYYDTYLITTSRLVAKNGVADIIKSLRYLPEEVKLLVVGNGELRAELIQLAHTLGVYSRVNFLGFLPHAEIPKYLAVSDIFIRPSLSEGFGNSFIEAMAAGLPVIATPVGGIPDFLIPPNSISSAQSGTPSFEKPTGLFCEVNDPESIARQVKLLLEKPELRTEITANAKALVSQKYEWNLVASQMRHILLGLADSKV